MPAETKLVVGVDFVAFRKTQVFARVLSALRKASRADEFLDTLKSTCKLDALAALQSFVFASAADTGDAVVYIGVNGLDRTKLADCMKAVGQTEKGANLSVKQDGRLTQIRLRDGDGVYLGWVDKEVLVASLGSHDKASLLKWMGGNGALASSELGKQLAKVDTAATLWMAHDGEKELLPGLTIEAVHGAVTSRNDTLRFEVHARVTDARTATLAADGINQRIAEGLHSSRTQPELSAILKTARVTADNDDVKLTATAVERDLLAVMPATFGPH